MNNKNPLVSIILPVRNQEIYLPFALESLTSQTYKNIEIIAIDDNSTDKSLLVVKRFRKHDKRIRIIKNKKQYGFCVCLNRGINKAKGDFIAFMNAQDQCLKTRIENQVRFLSTHPQIVVAGTFGTIINKNGRVLKKIKFPQTHEEIVKSLMIGFSMQFESTMINKNLLPNDIIKFNKNPYPFLFSEMFVKLIPYGLFININKSLYQRRHRKNLWTIKRYLFFIKLFLKGLAMYEHRPSPESFLLPFIKQPSTF